MNRQRGFSLVELMVASVLSLLILGALGHAVVQGSRRYHEDDSRARLDAEARFALAQLSADLEMAGWWAGLRGPEALSLDASAQDVGGGCASGFPTPIAIYDARLPCISAAEFQGGAIVAMQRVAGDVTPAGALSMGRVYLASTGARGVLFRAASAPPPPGVYYEYRPTIWYLRRYATAPGENPRVPALCRKVLGSDGIHMQADTGGCLAQGIEDLSLTPARDSGGQIAAVRVALSAHATERGEDFRRVASALALLRNAAWQSTPPGLP